MALVEPLIGHLLSQYTETVLEGLQKIRTNAAANPEFAPTIANSASAVEALKNTLLKQDKKPVVVNGLQTICTLVEHCASQPGSRAHLLREFCRGDVFAFLRKSVAVLSDDTLPLCMAALQLLTLMAVHVPRILLARFNHKLPLTLACFRAQLPYSQRRLRAARLEFLLALTRSKYSAVAASVVVSHGCLTQILDDAAELLLEGTEQGVKLGRAALRMFEEQFISSGLIPVEQKRAVLLAQRNVFRLFVKALEYPAVASDAERLVYRMVAELMESPSDYAMARTESAEDRGMPNFLLFFLLRQLRPKNSALVSRLVVFMLHKAPDLIRPYLTRVSGHLPDEGNTAQRVAPTTARVATLNVMTRVLLAPIPYHLSAHRITLEPIAARATTFYTMSPQAVVNEICPGWIAEYVHRLINGSTNLMMLTLAMQLTQAALERAQAVLALVAQVQAKQQKQRRLQRHARERGLAETDAHLSHGGNSTTTTTTAHTPLTHNYLLEVDEMDIDEDGHAVDWESFDAEVQAALQQALPRREEFWHRLTQQIHPLLLAQQQENFKQASANMTGSASLSRAEFGAQRMFALMRLYTDVFQLRVSWLSAVPNFVPTFSAADVSSKKSSGRKPIIGTALRMNNDVLCGWRPASISALCALLVPSLMRGVSMTKLHHITMSSSQGGVAEWPLLLSLLLWAVRVRESLPVASTQGMSLEDEEAVNAVAWIARLVQWTVHSVTVRFGCEFEESLAWVRSLTPETIPCFLHLLNSVLQRSLSKAADRVAKELFEAEGGKGVLVVAAEAFIARSQEKKQQRAEAAATQAVDLWTEDLYDNLDNFRAVVARVQGCWDSRTSDTASFCAVLVRHRGDESHENTSDALEGQHGQRRIALSSSSTAFLSQAQQHEALLPAHEQLLQFGRTLRAPVTMRGEEEIEPLVAITAQETDPATASMLPVLMRLGVARWAAMHTVCWEAAGFFLRRLNAIHHQQYSSSSSDSRTPDKAACESVVTSACALWSHIAEGAEAVQQSLLGDYSESRSLAFHVLMLALARVLLTVKGSFPAVVSAAVMTGTEVCPWFSVAENLLLSAYQGTTSTVDRVRYATLLSLHYLVSDSSEGAEASHTASQSEEEDAEDDKESHSDANDSESSEDDEEAGDASPNRSPQTSRKLFAGALVPCGFTQHRYLISGHSPAEYVTPEVDMLSLIVDAWTEDEIRTMALQAPLRLSNTILCSARQSEWDLVRSVFPEVTCEEDLLVTALARVTSATTADPRFLLPLLQVVLALPPERVARTVTLGMRCLPLLLRGLSCTEASLRELAAAAISTLYIPSGPNRIVTTFARMKLLQLWQKQDSSRNGGGRRRGFKARTRAKLPPSSTESTSLPRLPTPVGALLILALRPLGDYGHPLHNHLIRFLIDARNALGTSVPFAQWLSSFPLEAVSAPLMIKRHEALQKDGAQASSIAQTSAAEVSAQMRKDMPPQLDFILRLIGSACETNGDAMAMLRSECVQNVMLLADLISASPELRLTFVQTLTTMCSASYRVTLQLAVQARVLLWAISFALQLCREFAGSPHNFGDPLFTAVLDLIAMLSAVLGASPPHRHATLHGQAQELLRLLYRALMDAHVTAQQTLAIVEKAMRVWGENVTTTGDRLGQRRRRPQEAVAGNDAQKDTEEAAQSPAKKVRRK